MTQKTVPFQRWRVFWWAMKMASKAGINSESNPELSSAYRELAELGKEALVACGEGKQANFVMKLDILAGRTEAQAVDQELARWLDGKGDDLPEWLRK